MTVETLPFPTVKRSTRLDGEGSLQVQLDPDMKIGNDKVFAIYGKGGIGKSTPRAICLRPSQNWVNGCCKSAAIPSTTRPLP